MPRLRKPKEEIIETPQIEEGGLEVDLSAPVTPASDKKANGGEAPDTPQVTIAEPPSPQEDEEKVALKKRIEELERAEKAAQDTSRQLDVERRSKEELLRKSQEYQSEARRSQEDAAQAQYDSIINALGASQAEAEAAQREIEQAGEAADYKKMGEAQRRMGMATSRITQLEDAKASLDMRRETDKQRPVERPVSDPFEQAIASLPDQAKTWLRQHPEYVTDQEKRAEVSYLHHKALKAGHASLSPQYFEYIEMETGLKPRKEADDEEDNPPEPQRRAVVSAPVTREAPNMGSGKPHSNKVTLTAAEVDMAQKLGLEPQEYAKQKLRLAQLKKEGMYQ